MGRSDFVKIVSRRGDAWCRRMNAVSPRGNKCVGACGAQRSDVCVFPLFELVFVCIVCCALLWSEIQNGCPLGLISVTRQLERCLNLIDGDVFVHDNHCYSEQRKSRAKSESDQSLSRSATDGYFLEL